MTMATVAQTGPALEHSKETPPNFRASTYINEHKGRPTTNWGISNDTEAQHAAVSTCHMDKIKSLNDGTEKGDRKIDHLSPLLGKNKDCQNMIHHILVRVKKHKKNAKNWPLTEDFVKNSPAFVERLTVSRPDLCISEDDENDMIPFIFAAKFQVAIFSKITNLLIPDDVAHLILHHPQCQDDEIECPLYRVVPSLREQHLIETGVNGSHDAAKGANNAPAIRATEKLHCLRHTVDSKAVYRTIRTLKEKLKGVLDEPGKAETLLDGFLQELNFDTGTVEKLGRGFLRPESFRALLNLCPNSVFTGGDSSTFIPLHKALRMYHSQNIHQDFLLQTVESLVQRWPNSMFKVDNKKNAYQVLLPPPGKACTWTPVVDLLKRTCIGLSKDTDTDANEWEKMKTDFLYQDAVSARKIYFNVSGESSIINKDYISDVQKFASMQFESVLEYVKLPYWKPGRREQPDADKGNDAPPGPLSSDEDDSINNDDEDDDDNVAESNPYEHMFKWLVDAKVTKIFTVEVNDDGPEPHTNAAIRRAFGCENGKARFSVEVWKWKKFDICAETVAMSAPLAREIHLYSHGNIAVLRSWSISPGLASLINLKKLVVHVYPEHQDDFSDCSDYKSDFTETLAKTCPRLKSIDLKMKQDGHQSDSEQSSIEVNIYEKGKKGVEFEPLPPLYGVPRQWPREIHNPVEWLDKLRGFKQFMTRIKKRPDTKPIKVAILDDGVNVRRLRHNTVGRSFRADGVDYTVGPCPHGTDMARCILQVYPQAELYVGRLDDSGTAEAQKFTFASCYRALKWALDMGVQVVSMSWTFPLDADREDEYKTNFVDLIKNYQGEVVFFGSLPDIALDTGRGKEQHAPVCLQNVIKIGAADVYGIGTRDNFHAKADFLLPGQKQQNAGEARRGSSYATAYASGLAAAMLHCIQEHWRTKDKEGRYVNGSEGNYNGRDGRIDNGNSDLARVMQHATTKNGMEVIFKQLCKKDPNETISPGAFVLAHMALRRKVPDGSIEEQSELERIVNSIFPHDHWK